MYLKNYNPAIAVAREKIAYLLKSVLTTKGTIAFMFFNLGGGLLAGIIYEYNRNLKFLIKF